MSEWRHGKPTSQRQFAALLKPFRIFQGAWRYLRTPFHAGLGETPLTLRNVSPSVTSPISMRVSYTFRRRDPWTQTIGRSNVEQAAVLLILSPGIITYSTNNCLFNSVTSAASFSSSRVATPKEVGAGPDRGTAVVAVVGRQVHQWIREMHTKLC